MTKQSTNAANKGETQHAVTKGVSKTSSFQAGMLLINTALTSVRATFQSVTEMEPRVAEAALYAVRHASEHGDVSLADKLVRGVREIMGRGKTHPMIQTMYNELFAWFRANSPIRWDASGKCSLDKERGWKEKDLENAESAAFFETERAQAARDSYLQNQKRTLEPLTFDNWLARLKGVVKMAQRVNEPDKEGNIRGFKSKGDAKLIREASDLIMDTIASSFPGSVKEELPEGPISERGKRKEAVSDKPSRSTKKAA